MSHKYQTQPIYGTVRYTVQQLHKATDPKFAVFMRSASGSSAKFKALTPDLETAIEVARKHASTAVSNGETDFTYYAVEIKHRVGIEKNKPVDEPMK